METGFHLPRKPGLETFEVVVAAHAPMGMGADGGAYHSEPQTPLECQGVRGERLGRDLVRLKGGEGGEGMR